MSTNRLALRLSQGITLVICLGLCVLESAGGSRPSSPVQVTIRDDKPVTVSVESSMPVDPVQRIHFTNQMNLCPSIQAMPGDNINNRGTLHLSYFPTLKVDEQIFQMFQGMVQLETANAPLPKTASGKERKGFMSIARQGDIRIVMTAELVPTQPPAKGQKRRLDAVLIKYSLENKGKVPHKVGLRVYLDAYCITNDGAQFAAPTMPGKILNGVELKGKTMPDYVQKLQQPNLKNPGFVAHISLNMGKAGEKADRIVLTQHGTGFNTWDMPAQQAGDTAVGIFWEQKEIKPGGKRDIAYAYGQGLAIKPDNEGQFQIGLGGSFEPGKLFTIAATVNDPAPGMSLSLELPPGMERVEGKEMQPVSVRPEEEGGPSMVVWKARVHKLGEFPIRVRSTTGLTQTKTVTIRANDAKTN